jgi:hypothetical protein
VSNFTMFDTGRDLLAGWGVDDYRFMLTVSFGFDRVAQSVVADLGNEVSVIGYQRIPPAGPIRVVDTGAHVINYTCADPDWGSLNAGQVPDGIVLFKLGTNDFDSPLVAWANLDSPVDTGDLDPYVVNLGGGQVVTL